MRRYRMVSTLCSTYCSQSHHFPLGPARLLASQEPSALILTRVRVCIPLYCWTATDSLVLPLDYSQCVPGTPAAPPSTSSPPPTTTTSAPPGGVTVVGGVPQYNIILTGQLEWDLIFDYDNTNNSGSIQLYTEVTTSEYVYYSTFDSAISTTSRTEIESAGAAAEVGASYAGVSAKVSTNIAVSSEVTDALTQTVQNTMQSSYNRTITSSRQSMCCSLHCMMLET